MDKWFDRCGEKWIRWLRSVAGLWVGESLLSLEGAPTSKQRISRSLGCRGTNAQGASNTGTSRGPMTHGTLSVLRKAGLP